MPIKSKAQRRKFAELLVEGKIEPETFERWNREAGGAELPERVRPKKKKAAKKKAKKKAQKKAQKQAKKKTTTRRAKARNAKKR